MGIIMKNFITVMFALLVFIMLPSIASAQSVIRDCEVQKCYKVLFPFPHSRCECVDYNYHPRYVPRRHYHPVPPKGHRPGHHPPPHRRGSAR